SLRELASACRELVDGLRAQLDPQLKPRPFLVTLFAKPADESDPTVPNLRNVCISQLATQSADNELMKVGQGFVVESDTMRALADQIDLSRAKALAVRDMAFPRDVVHSIFHELNVWSLGPALMFDGARIDLGTPAHESAGRFALGAGLRLTLASTFHMTAGYV